MAPFVSTHARTLARMFARWRTHLHADLRHDPNECNDKCHDDRGDQARRRPDADASQRGRRASHLADLVCSRRSILDVAFVVCLWHVFAMIALR